MICETFELAGRAGKPPPPGSAPELEIEMDLERLVWDPEYREQMRRCWRRLG